jgi:colicin import membrane protein
MRRMWLAAIPALALACATSKSDEQKMSGTARNQSQAQQKLQRAADAQKHALEEQQKAEKAQQDVVNAQKALADAQAKLAGQRAKAEQAQREAQQSAQEAQQEAQRDQQRASQMQRQDAQQQSQLTQQNQQAWTQAKNVRGQAVTASRDEVLVRSSDQGELRLKVNDSTAISVDGKMASAEDIKPGQDVRASYQVVDGQPTALRIEASMPTQSSEPKK